MKKKNIDYSSIKPHGVGFYCDDLILEKINFVSDALKWTRNSFILESISHIIYLIERYKDKTTPNFLVVTRALQQAGIHDFHSIEELKNSVEDKKTKTVIAIPKFLLKKIDHIADSTGYSRNSFIIECVIHSLNIIRDGDEDTIPNVVKIARAVAIPMNLSDEPQESNQLNFMKKSD